MNTRRTALSVITVLLVLLLPEGSALARPGGGFSGSHGGGFSGAHSGFSGGHTQASPGGHWGGHGWGYHGGGWGYGHGYYGGFYGGVYADPWAWGYAYPPVVGYGAYAYDDAPPVAGAYVERAPPVQSGGQPMSQPNTWYYCSNPAGYYPYVNNCSVTWQQVPATPQN